MQRWFPYVSRTRYSSEGVNEAWIVRCEAVGKTTADHPYIIANEWISANIAQFLRLPVPPFSLMRKRDRRTAMFASYSFEGDTTPGDVRPFECFREHPHLCSGILAFDILIANCDRHRGNVKVDNPPRPRRVHIIDHDRALLYVYPGEGISRLRSLVDRLGITGGSVSRQSRHIFLDVVDTAEHFAEWASRIRDIPKWFLRDVCSDVQGIGVRKRELAEVVAFLTERRDRLGSLILANKHEFPSISDWPLVL